MEAESESEERTQVPRQNTAGKGRVLISRTISQMLIPAWLASRPGRFLLLESAAIELMRQSETLAERIAYVDMSPLQVLETGTASMETLWLRGGFPDSYLAAGDAEGDDFGEPVLHGAESMTSPAT